MNRLYYKSLAVIFFSFYAQSMFGQRSICDLTSWTALSAEYKIGKKTKVQLEEQFRSKNTLSTFDNAFTQLEIKRELPKNLDFTLGFRYKFENDDVGNKTGIERHFRLHSDLNHKFDWNRLEISNRLRYQRSNELNVSEAEGDYTLKQLRLRTAVELKIKNWEADPRFSVEWFYRNQIGALNGMHQYRLGLDTKLNVFKKSEVKIGYYFENDIAFWEVKKTHILSLKYQFSVN